MKGFNVGGRYLVQNELAPAIYGNVLLAQDTQDGGTSVVLKRFNSKLLMKNLTSLQQRVCEDVAQEIKINTYLQRRGGHNNVVAFKNWLCDDKNMYLVMEHCNGGELLKHVECMAMERALETFGQIVNGMAFLHRHEIAHRDLSLENVLLHDGIARVCDFGLVACGKKQRHEVVGKEFYRAPEVWTASVHQPYDPFAADVWSLGIILVILLTGAPPFESATDDDLRFRTFKRMGLLGTLQRQGIDHCIPNEMQGLLSQLLTVAPHERISMFEVQTQIELIKQTGM